MSDCVFCLTPSGVDGAGHGRDHPLRQAQGSASTTVTSFLTLRDPGPLMRGERFWALIKTQSVFIKAQNLYLEKRGTGPRAESCRAVRRRQDAVEGCCRPWTALLRSRRSRSAARPYPSFLSLPFDNNLSEDLSEFISAIFFLEDQFLT